MSKPINLNKARKEKARADARAEADRNAVLHGLPKSAKVRAKADAERALKAHARHRKDPKR